jgi:DNA-binding CsgD family transcriptional regulator/PAS domain-containing protein
MQGLKPEVLSSVIAEIYDCALNPDGWVPVLTRVNALMKGAYTTISLADPGFQLPRMVAYSEWDPVMLKILNEEYGVEGVPGLMEVATGDVDTPRSTLNQMSREAFFATPFYQNWASPQGLLDACVMKFASTSDRVGAMATVTSAKRDIVSADERRFMGLLSPHIRRASLIGDLLDHQRVQTDALKTVLDRMNVPVILVTRDTRIIYANASASQCLSAEEYVYSDAGRLFPRNTQMAAALHDCITRCAGDVDDLGSRGIGIPLSSAAETSLQRSAVAYVLPLRDEHYRTSFHPAIAAVFVSSSERPLPPQQDVLATLYDLTPSEAKVMSLAGAGSTTSSIAVKLGVSENTIKTHLSRVFGKTGVNRQIDLSQLVNSLSPPIS